MRYQGSDDHEIRDLMDRIDEPDLPFFRIDPEADVNGTSLRLLLGPNLQKVVESFESREGYWDDQKGYDGEEWTFVDQHGRVFNCYRRYGVMRVAANSGLFGGETYPVDPFIEFLEAMEQHVRGQ